MRKRTASTAGAVAALAVLLLAGFFVSVRTDMEAGGTPNPPTTSVPPGDPSPECGEESGFLAYFATGNRFGPPVTATDTDEILAQLHRERCLDSAKTVAHDEYADRAYTSPEERARRTRELRDNPGLRAAKVKELEDKEATAVKVEVTTLSNRYQTMYMVTEGHDVPYIYATSADRPTFQVLKFTYADGTWDAYKLDCDFQPVATSFPGLPTGPPAPPAEPVTPPPGETPPPPSEGGKDHRRSPVSDDPNDACEACRPNTPEPERPTQTVPHNPNPEGGAGPSDSGEGATATTQPSTTVAPPIAPPVTASPSVPVTSP